MIKRILSCLLVLLLLFSSVSILTACRKKKTVETVVSDWEEYTIVYSKNALNDSSVLSDVIKSIFPLIKARTGQPVDRRSTDPSGEVESEDPEILIGDTDRIETATAKSRISGDGWCILPVNNKIVIYGTTTLLTRQAVQAFIETYLPEGGTDTAPQGLKEEIRSDVEMVEINEKIQLTCDANLDYEKNGDGDVSPYYDYPVVAARLIRDTVARICGIQSGSILVTKDNKGITKREIVVGLTKRQITKDLVEKLGNVDRYGFLVEDGHVAVAGYNDVTLAEAVTLFNNCLNEAKRENEDGTTSSFLPEGFSMIKTTSAGSKWVTDFPKPSFDDLTLTDSVDVGSNSMEYLYTGEGANAANFEAYCRTLTENGYELYTSNAIEDSLYRTFYNQQKKATLYVTYSALKHAEEQGVTLFPRSIRIISAPVGTGVLTQVKLMEQVAFDKAATLSSYTKVTDTRITALQIDYRGENGRSTGEGSGHIITLEDGSFIVLDGGMNNYTGSSADRIYYTLCDLYQLAHGVEPNETDHRITIAAWYVSHLHFDHASNFFAFAEKHGKKIDAERLIANFYSDSEIYNSVDPNGQYRDMIPQLCNYFGTKMSYYKVHTGWKFYIRNIEFEILYTHEDLCPVRINPIDSLNNVKTTYNETSTAIRMTIFSTDGNGNTQGTPTTALWLGDLQNKGSRFMRAAYGNYMESDMCQISHHGYYGVEYELYALVNPTCLWWPTAYDVFKNYVNKSNFKNSSEYYKRADYGVYNSLGVEYVILCDTPGSSYSANVTVTITKDGPQYALDQLYNADSRLTDHTISGYGNKTTAASIIKATDKTP